MSSDETERQGVDDTERDHVSELEDGSSCAEIWEHLSEKRAE